MANKLTVVCYGGSYQPRANHVAKAMILGFKRHGIEAQYEMQGNPRADLVISYGWRNAQMFNTVRRRGNHYLYLDLGYWKRRPRIDRREGYYKVCLDAWCPLEHMKRGCPNDRFLDLGIGVKPWRSGETVLVAGMSHKSANGHGLMSEKWERAIINQLRKATKRQIVYRPKPSWREASPITGSEYSRPSTPLEYELRRAHCVVTHHSNVAIDGIIEGVPTYCETGAGSAVSTVSLADIDNPQMPSDDERATLLNDLAYCQWTPNEMRSGECWEHFKGLI